MPKTRKRTRASRDPVPERLERAVQSLRVLRAWEDQLIREIAKVSAELRKAAKRKSRRSG